MLKKVIRLPNLHLPFFCLSLAALSSGCGLLIGNVKPVEEKSDQYGIADLAKENPQVWARLTDTQQGADAKDPEATSTEVPDVAFQSARSAAVISINSSCRPPESALSSNEPRDPSEDLKALANQLTYGISQISQRTERNLTLQGAPALQTTLQGKMNRNDIALRTVVLRKNGCVYDLLYMAPPARFKDNEADFDHFVASLRLK
jgi:hypothetical protein